MKNNKLFKFITLASMFFSPVLLTNTVSAEAPSGIVPSIVTDNGAGQAVLISLPSYIRESKNVNVKNYEDYNVYTTKLKFDDEHGVVVVVIQFNKPVENKSFLLNLENGITNKDISDSSNWYYNEYIGSYQGGSLSDSPTSFGRILNAKSGSLVQYAVPYRLKDENRVKINFSEITSEEVDNIFATESEAVANVIQSEKNVKLEVGELKEAKNVLPTYDEEQDIVKKEQETKAKEEAIGTEAEEEVKEQDKNKVKKTKSEVKEVKRDRRLFYIVSSISATLFLVIAFFARRYVKNK